MPSRRTSAPAAAPALFRTALLRRYLPASRCYHPFYWEDVEWGVRAWRDGLRVLFAPRSRVSHRHRASTARFFAEPELGRIVQRNRWLFDARHAATRNGLDWLMDRICDLPYEHASASFARLPVSFGVFRARLSAQRHPQPLRPPQLLAGERRTRRAAATFVQLSPGCRGRGAADAPAHAADHAVRGLSAAARRCAARGRNRARPRRRVRRRADHRRGAALRRAQLRPFRRPLRGAPGAARRGCPRARRRERWPSACGRIAIARSWPPSSSALAEYRPELVQVEHAELAGLVRMQARRPALDSGPARCVRAGGLRRRRRGAALRKRGPRAATMR